MSKISVSQQTELTLRHFLSTNASPQDKAHACLSSGQKMEQIRDFDSAVTCYSLAFGLEPQANDVWYFIHNNLGYSLNQLGKRDEAEVYCRQAIQINPERHNAFKNLGAALEGQGQYVEAAHHFAQAVVLQPEDTRAFEHLETLMEAHPGLPESLANVKAELLDLYKQRGLTHCTAAEVKVTAAVYSLLAGVVEHVRSAGRLPDNIDGANAPEVLTKIVQSRGVEIDLTPDEQLVYAAMVTEGRMTGGIAQLSDPAAPVWHFFTLATPTPDQTQ